MIQISRVLSPVHRINTKIEHDDDLLGPCERIFENCNLSLRSMCGEAGETLQRANTAMQGGGAGG
jgi:hypothetical protein